MKVGRERRNYLVKGKKKNYYFFIFIISFVFEKSQTHQLQNLAFWQTTNSTFIFPIQFSDGDILIEFMKNSRDCIRAHFLFMLLFSQSCHFLLFVVTQQLTKQIVNQRCKLQNQQVWQEHKGKEATKAKAFLSIDFSRTWLSVLFAILPNHLEI